MTSVSFVFQLTGTKSLNEAVVFWIYLRMQQKIRLQDFQTAEKNVFLTKNSRHYTPEKFTGYTVYFHIFKYRLMYVSCHSLIYAEFFVASGL
jgi:hypothetical protein